MNPDDERQAWIESPTRAQLRAARPPGSHPHDFGFVAGMSRLLMAHACIGPALWSSTTRSCAPRAT
jgi:hypothetical protein